MMSDTKMTNDRYLAAIRRVKRLIEGGLILTAHDDTTPGCHSTECSWGLCTKDKEHWPDALDYLWPENPDRVAPKYLKDGQPCPMDKREMGGSGCFYHCRVFSRSKTPTKDEAIKLYDLRIGEAKKRFGRSKT